MSSKYFVTDLIKFQGGSAMPTYEYKCEDCKKTFFVYTTITEHEKNPNPPCEHCSSSKVKQQFSSVSVITSKKS